MATNSYGNAISPQLRQGGRTTDLSHYFQHHSHISQWFGANLVQFVIPNFATLPKVEDRIPHFARTLYIIKSELAERYHRAKYNAVHSVKAHVPRFLGSLSDWFVRLRSYSLHERQLQKILQNVHLCFMLIGQRTKTQQVAYRQIVTNEVEAIVEPYQEEVSEIVQFIKIHGVPNVIPYEHFTYLPREKIYYFERGVTCLVPHKRYENGTLVITNQRVVYYSEMHKQVYKITNIRDFVPCWRFQEGMISVASSERRNENYSSANPWLMSLILMFFGMMNSVR